MNRFDGTVERGETIIPVVIAVPIVVSMLLISVQATLFLHSAHIAALASSKGASLAANSEQNLGSAINSATVTVADMGGHLVGSPTASVSGQFATVTVRVAVPNIAPFFPDSVERSAEEPLEIFVPEDER